MILSGRPFTVQVNTRLRRFAYLNCVWTLSKTEARKQELEYYVLVPPRAAIRNQFFNVEDNWFV